LEPSFGRLVFGRALADTGRFLGYTKRDIILGGITLALGGFLAYVFVGKADTLKEFAFIAAFTFAPAGIVMIAIFVWHLWLAPSVLAYEAVRSAAALSTTAPKQISTAPTVNWAIWKQRSQYNLAELSSILAKEDPHGMSSHSATAFLDLLKEEVMGRKLATIKDSEAGPYQTADLWPTYYSLPKDAALKWAADKGFDLSHIA